MPPCSRRCGPERRGISPEIAAELFLAPQDLRADELRTPTVTRCGWSWLPTMRERAQELGGTLAIANGVLHAELPLG
jgi:hypothetical protein